MREPRSAIAKLPLGWPPRSFQRKNNDYGGAESLTCDDSVQGQLMALFGLTLAASL